MSNIQDMRGEEHKETGQQYVTDRAYAWIVLFGVSLSTFLEMGNAKTFGIYFVLFLEEFKASATMTSLINAIYSFSFSLFVVPVETVLVERFSCRSILFIGSLATSIALICSSFVTNIETLIFTNGIILALGSACTHGPSMIILGKYFDKRRGLANTIAISFGSLGGCVQPILFTAMVSEFGLRGALLLHGGILLNCAITATLSRPLHKSIKLAEINFKSKDKVREKDNHGKEDILKTLDVEDSDEIAGKRSSPRASKQLCIQETTANLSTSTSSIAQYSSGYDLYSISMADDHKNTESTSESKEHNKGICSFCVDFSILRNKLVLLFAIVFFLATLASCSAILFIPPHARDRGLSEQDVSIVASVISVSEFFGRLFLALVADRKFIQRYQIIMIALFMNGVTLQFTSFLTDYDHFIIFTICYGTFSGALFSLYAPVCVDFIGVNNFHKAMGVLHMGHGIALGTAGLLLGVLRDHTESYVAGFHILGGSGILAAALLLLVPRLRDRTTT